MSHHHSGQRLDRLFRKVFPTLSLSKIHSTLRKKKVRLNGVRAKVETMVEKGDKVQIYEFFPDPLFDKSSSWGDLGVLSKKLNVLEESDELLILNKETGISVHPGSGVPDGKSLIEQVWIYTGLSGQAQLAHRLDKGTSGVIAIGKDGPMIRKLTGAIRQKKGRKIYLALVNGEPAMQGKIEVALDRTDAKIGSKMVIGSGKQSVTYFKKIKQWKDSALLEVELGTGRMHQIRAHLSSIGHSLIGDDRYGDFDANKAFRREHKLRRIFLHASELELEGIGLWKAPLPAELQKVLDSL